MSLNLKNRIINSISSQFAMRLFFDVLAIIISFALQYYIRYESGIIHPVKQTPDLSTTITTFFVMLSYWLLMLFFWGAYKNWRMRSPIDEIFNIIKTSLIGCGIIIFIIFTDNPNNIRALFLVYFLTFSISVIIGRTISRRIQIKLRQKRIVVSPAILIGSAKKTLEFYEKNQNVPSWGYEIIGVVIIDENEFSKFEIIKKELNLDLKFLGFQKDLENILKLNPVHEVSICTEKPEHSLLLDIVSKASGMGVKVNIEPDLYDIFTGRTRAQNIYGIPLIEIRTQLLKPWQESIKRIFDIVFSALVIILGAPLWALIAIIIKLESKGSVFYTQPRVGKNGKIFVIYKYRSMKQVAVQGNVWTSVHDPRVTKFGKFIRKTHLDEAPQFLNALLGDMSVVGPRPEQPKMVEEFISQLPHYKRRLIVRPGITGWWQVKYKPYTLSIEEIENRLKDDFYYIENMSIKLDIEIVVRTVWCVLKGHGQA